MKQTRIDSLMESVVNVIIGLIISTIANHFVFVMVLHIPLTLTVNLGIGAFFTVISIVRSYTIRRLFNGRSVWQAIKDEFFRSHRCPVAREAVAAAGAGD